MRERNLDAIGLGGALLLVGTGLLLAEPLLVAGAFIPLLYLLYGLVSTVPTDRQLSADRSVNAQGSTPGDSVEVTLTIENTGETVLPDVRVVDGVPEELGVVEGTPRRATALLPDESVQLSYTVVLSRGQFEFDDPLVRLRSMAGTNAETEALSVTGDSSLSCATPISDPPATDDTLAQTGAVPTDAGGPGLEFHSTRQYHHGDPMNRIDWHHVAKTGEFVTVKYRREQNAKAVIVVDCRPVGRVTPLAGYPTGAAMAAYAGEGLYRAMDAAGVFTTVTAVGLDGTLDHLTDADGLPWIRADGDGSASPQILFQGIYSIAGENSTPFPTRSGGREGTEAAGVQSETSIGPTAKTAKGVSPKTTESPGSANSKEPTAGRKQARGDGGATMDWTDRVLSRIGPQTQVVLCSPLLDDWPVEFVSDLAARQHTCVVVSPDVTAGNSYGKRLGGVLRRQRLRQLEGEGAETVDWPIDQPLEQHLRQALPTLFINE